MPFLHRLSSLDAALVVALVVLGVGGLLFGASESNEARPTPSLLEPAAAACPTPLKVGRGRARADLAGAIISSSSPPALDRQMPAEVQTATFAVG